MNYSTENQPLFLQLSHEDRKSALETIIFSSDEPVSIADLNALLIKKDYSENSEELFNDSVNDYLNKKSPRKYINPEISELFISLIDEINQDLEKTSRPYFIVSIAGGYQFATRPEFGELISRLEKTKVKRRLSQAALEVLAVVAYKQPVTKPEIEQIRGVGSGDVILSLVEKRLIEVTGKRDTLGKPLLYGTTMEFLKQFGLNSLDELPKLREFEEISEPEESPLPHLEIVVNKLVPKEIEILENGEEEEYI